MDRLGCAGKRLASDSQCAKLIEMKLLGFAMPILTGRVIGVAGLYPVRLSIRICISGCFVKISFALEVFAIRRVLREFAVENSNGT